MNRIIRVIKTYKCTPKINRLFVNNTIQYRIFNNSYTPHKLFCITNNKYNKLSTQCRLFSTNNHKYNTYDKPHICYSKEALILRVFLGTIVGMLSLTDRECAVWLIIIFPEIIILILIFIACCSLVEFLKSKFERFNDSNIED